MQVCIVEETDVLCASAQSGSVGISTTRTVTRNVDRRNKLFIPYRLPGFSVSGVSSVASVSCVRETGAILGRFLASFATRRLSCYISNTCTTRGFSSPTVTLAIGVSNGGGVLRL